MKIIVSDASTVPVPEKVIAQANRHVTYIHVPQTSSDPEDVSTTWLNRMCDATSLIDTEFAVMRSNRRHTLISGLFNARNFLQQNRDYASVQGHTFNAGQDGSIRPGYYKYHMIDVCEADCKYERMQMGMLYYTPIFYALQRTERLQTIFRLAPRLGAGSFSELFHALLTLYYGKHKALPCAYCCNLNRPDRPEKATSVKKQDTIIASLSEISAHTARVLDAEDPQLPAALCSAFINYYMYFCECYKILSTSVVDNTFKQHFINKFGTTTFDSLLHTLIAERQLTMDDVTRHYSVSNQESIQECLHFFKDCFVK